MECSLVCDIVGNRKINISLFKQQFVVTQRYSVLQNTRKTWYTLNRAYFKHIMFLIKYKEKQLFIGKNILTEGVFLTQVSGKAGISV
jgi:phosphatidylinositol kinase/protein kinase (PI-3  family)